MPKCVTTMASPSSSGAITRQPRINTWPPSPAGRFRSAQFNLANLLLTQDHRPDLAAPYFAAAIAANPARPDYRVNYAVALRALGQLDAARAQCLAALQINPNFAPAKRAPRPPIAAPHSNSALNCSARPASFSTAFLAV